jgi:hypothetical protein
MIEVLNIGALVVEVAGRVAAMVKGGMKVNHIREHSSRGFG